MATVGGDPAHDYHCDDRPEVDFYNQAEHVQHRPDQKGDGIDRRDPAVKCDQDQEKRDGLNNHGQHQGGAVNATPARDEAAQRAQRRIGRLDHELGDRVVEIRAGQLQQETQQHDRQVKGGRDQQDGDQNVCQHEAVSPLSVTVCRPVLRPFLQSA